MQMKLVAEPKTSKSSCRRNQRTQKELRRTYQRVNHAVGTLQALAQGKLPDVPTNVDQEIWGDGSSSTSMAIAGVQRLVAAATKRSTPSSVNRGEDAVRRLLGAGSTSGKKSDKQPQSSVWKRGDLYTLNPDGSDIQKIGLPSNTLTGVRIHHISRRGAR